MENILKWDRFSEVSKIVNDQNISIWPIDETLTGTSTLSQSGPESNDKEGLSLLPQRSKTRAFTIRCNLVSYQKHLLGGRGVGYYASAEA